MASTTATGSSSSANAEVYAALNASNSSLGSTSTSKNNATTAKEQNDRFLKLLTTQLTNQDPLNPLDNSQMTSQLTQISTVSGLEELNTTIASLSNQFLQLQAMQGASLVGREVTVEGNKLNLADGKAKGSYELSAAADTVSVEVLNAAGTVVKTATLGKQTAGRHDFDFASTGLSSALGYTFRVVAQTGTTTLDATELVRDKVTAVNTSGKTLTLELANSGSVAYSAVQAIN